jgi:hypothetical protein
LTHYRAPRKRKELDPESVEAKVEKLKNQIRTKVEHPFRYIKRVFEYEKVRYPAKPRTGIVWWCWQGSPNS